jgi:outer membrane protein assembly factor BamB
LMIGSIGNRALKRLGAAAMFALAIGGCDWPQLRGGAARSGFNSGEGCCGQVNPISVANAGNLHQIWQSNVGDPSVTYQHNYSGDPIVSTGRVFVSGGDGSLHAYNALTGAALWTASITGGDDFVTAQPSAPAADASTVYVASTSVASVPNQVFAFSAGSGATVWTATVAGVGWQSSPALSGARLYIGTDSGVTALNVSTGSVAWQASTGTATTWVAIGAAAYYGTGGTVKALDLTTGQVLWTSSAFGGAVNNIAVSGDTLYARFGNTMRALNGSNGNQIWAATSLTADSAAAVANGLVYMVTGNGSVRGLNQATGIEVWSTAAGHPNGVSVANGVLFAANPYRAFDASAGTQLVNLSLNNGTGQDPTVANGILYVSDTYMLRAFAP